MEMSGGFFVLNLVYVEILIKAKSRIGLSLREGFTLRESQRKTETSNLLLDKPCSFFFCEVDIRIKGNTIH